MNTKWIISISCLSVVLLLLGYSIYLGLQNPKIGYVRSSLFLEKYEGMKDARSSLESKLNRWEVNVDTLEMNYRKSLNQYNASFASLSEDERENFREMLSRQNEELDKYIGVIEKKVLKENEKVTVGVTRQVNDFIEKYADEHGYDLIFGVTGTGNIVYGNNAIDLSEEILEAMNKDYLGK